MSKSQTSPAGKVQPSVGSQRSSPAQKTLCVSCVCANYCTVIFGWGVAAACTPGHAGRQCCTCTAAFEKQHLAFNWDTPRPLLSSSGVCIRACTPSPMGEGAAGQRPPTRLASSWGQIAPRQSKSLLQAVLSYTETCNVYQRSLQVCLTCMLFKGEAVPTD